METFERRLGLNPKPSMLASDYLPEELERRLYNVLAEKIAPALTVLGRTSFAKAVLDWWIDEQGRHRGEIANLHKGRWTVDLSKLADLLHHEHPWWTIYSLIEYCMNTMSFTRPETKEDLGRILQRQLQLGGSAYSWTDAQFVPAVTPIEEASLQEATEDSDSLVAQHLSEALRLLGPGTTDEDYRHSIKESISAVERAFRHAAGDDVQTLGTALKVLKKDLGLSPRLAAALEAHYAWTNGPEGIRHSLMADHRLTRAEALYMAVTSSAIITYLRTREHQRKGPP